MSSTSDQSNKTRVFNLTLAAVAGQVGCLTTLIVLAALFGGLWLDNRFDTMPMFTVGLIVASVPVTLVAMVWIVKATTSRMQMNTEGDSMNRTKEELTSE